MTRAYVLDRATLEVLGLIDQSFTKLTYSRRYQAMDTLVMTINRKRLYADQVEKGRLIFLPDEGDRVFLVEQIETVQSGEQAKDLMTVTGRSLEGISMAERIIIPPVGESHDVLLATPAESAIKHYVDANAVTTVDPDRAVPNLVIAADAAGGVNVDTAGRYQTVLDFVIDIGLLSGLGWEIVLDKDAGEFVFDTIDGVDRSTTVFFDFDFETLEQWDELDSDLDSKTVAVVAGQGEGLDRDIVVRGSAAGFDRREAFVDARDIEQGETTLLEQRGDTLLAELSGETALEATIHQFGSFRYREDWDLGDIVLVRDTARSIEYAARIVEVSVTFDETIVAPTVVATLGRPFPTLRSRSSSGASTADGGGAASISGIPAGGVLSGTYPNPGFAVDMATQAELDALDLIVDGALLDISTLIAASHARSHDHSNASDGTALAPATVQISGTSDITLASTTTDPFRIGPTSGANIAMDANEIQARSNGATATLTIQGEGGRLSINPNVPGSTNADGILIGGDVTLYRAGANVLATDDEFRVGSPTTASSSGVLIRQTGAVELVSNASTPYLDWKNDATEDFDARLILTGNDQLELQGADIEFENDVAILGDLTLASIEGSTVDSGSGTITIAGDGTATFSTQAFEWVKIGRLVVLSFAVTVTANGSTSSTVTFTFPGAPLADATGRVWMDRGGTGVQPIVARFINSGGSMQFSNLNRLSVGAAYTDQSTITGADLVNGASFQGTFAYMASS